MDNFENKILEKIDSYRRKRNYIRKVIQTLFVVFFCLGSYVIYSIPGKSRVQIDIVRNYLVNTSELQNAIYGYLEKRNFFFVSPRNLSEYLLQTYGLIDNVIVRKYLLPDYKVVVFISEKKIWAKLIFDEHIDDSTGTCKFITEGAKLVSADYINLNLVPSQIVTISVNREHLPSREILNNLKIFLDRINKRNTLNLRFINVLPNEEVEMIFQNELKVSVGKLLSDDIKLKSERLLASLELIERNEKPVNYLHLGLDNIAVFKSDINEHKKEEGRFRIGIFKKKHRNE